MGCLHGLERAVSSLWVVCCPWACCVAPLGTALAGLGELPKKKKPLWGPAAVLPHSCVYHLTQGMYMQHGYRCRKKGQNSADSFFFLTYLYNSGKVYSSEPTPFFFHLLTVVSCWCKKAFIFFTFPIMHLCILSSQTTIWTLSNQNGHLLGKQSDYMHIVWKTVYWNVAI